MDYLVYLTGTLLKRHPKQLAFLAPVVTWLLVVTSGTGMSSFALFPVITEVAKGTNMRPSRPLTLSAIASMTAIVASPVSAAVVYFSGVLDEKDPSIGYLGLLGTTIPATLIGIIATAAIMLAIDKVRGTLTLSSVESQKMSAGNASGEPRPDGLSTEALDRELSHLGSKVTASAKRSVWIFVITLILIITYAILISPQVGIVETPVLPRDTAIISAMLAAGAAIVAFCKVRVEDVLSTSTFKSGGSSYVCCLGVAWLGTTFVTANQDTIVNALGGVLESAPWLLAVVLVVASSLLYSQAATAKALMPLALSLVSPAVAVASFPAVAGFFLLPTYPTVVGTVAIDDTGSTKIGKYVFNHSFIVPDVINMIITVAIRTVLISVIS
jgi:anaerobic C4-dicarboxylate transporter DcuA